MSPSNSSVVRSVDRPGIERIARRFYHNIRWLAFTISSGGKAGEIYWIDPETVTSGQLPGSQFPRRARRFILDGDWDTEVIAIEDHSVFLSLKTRFVDGKDWEETVHYDQAKKAIHDELGFHGTYSMDEVFTRFREWDQLYDHISTMGFLSVKEQYRRKLIDNPCKRLDEITVNLSRDGTPLLNDGWHRFCIAKILGLSTVPVRILARHGAYGKWLPKKLTDETDSVIVTLGS